MGWDLTVINVVDGSRSIDELSESSVEALGTKETITDRLMAVFPGIDASNSEWLALRGEHYSLEFSLGSDDEISSFMIHVHGDDEQAVNAVATLCRHTGWSVLDAAIGDLIDFRDNHAQDGYLKWRSYKHHVQNRHGLG